MEEMTSRKRDMIGARSSNSTERGTNQNVRLWETVERRSLQRIPVFRQKRFGLFRESHGVRYNMQSTDEQTFSDPFGQHDSNDLVASFVAEMNNASFRAKEASQLHLVKNAGDDQPDSLEPAKGRRYLKKDQSIFLQGDKQCWLIQVKEISLLESEGNYTRVYFGNEKTLILRSLNSLEGRLDPAMFFRASRKHIINISSIEKIVPAATRTLLVTLRDGFKVEMSRRQAQLFRMLMTL
jgi:DNA-binding LytR/AlgR family response regulator